jgi:hypothetical protein
LDFRDLDGIDVERRNLASGPRKGEAEGKPDVSASADDDNVRLGRKESLARCP